MSTLDLSQFLRMKDDHEQEFGFCCSSIEIGNFKEFLRAIPPSKSFVAESLDQWRHVLLLHHTVEIMDLCNSKPCSNFCHTLKIWSVKSRTGLKPTWFFSVVLYNRRRIIKEGWDGIVIRLNPLWLSHKDFTPFLKMNTITDLHQPRGISSLTQSVSRTLKIWVSFI